MLSSMNASSAAASAEGALARRMRPIFVSVIRSQATTTTCFFDRLRPPLPSWRPPT